MSAAKTMTPAQVAAAIGELSRRMAALEVRLTPAMPQINPAVPFHMATYAWVRRMATVIAEEWEVSSVELLGARQFDHIIRPRFVLYWVVRETAGYSYPVIARMLGRGDHTTIIHGRQRVIQWRETDEVFRYATDQLLVIAKRLRGERPAKLPEPETEQVPE